MLFSSPIPVTSPNLSRVPYGIYYLSLADSLNLCSKHSLYFLVLPWNVDNLPQLLPSLQLTMFHVCMRISILLLAGMFTKCLLDQFSIFVLKSSIYLWIFLIVLSIVESVVLKSPIIISQLYISPFNYVIFSIHVIWDSFKGHICFKML